MEISSSLFPSKSQAPSYSLVQSQDNTFAESEFEGCTAAPEHANENCIKDLNNKSLPPKISSHCLSSNQSPSTYKTLVNKEGHVEGESNSDGGGQKHIYEYSQSNIKHSYSSSLSPPSHTHSPISPYTSHSPSSLSQSPSSISSGVMSGECTAIHIQDGVRGEKGRIEDGLVELKPFTYVGKLFIVWKPKRGKFFVCGPHWPFAIVMLLLKLGVSAGFLISMASIPVPDYFIYIGVVLVGCSITIFVLTVLTEPGIIVPNSQNASYQLPAVTIGCRSSDDGSTSGWDSSSSDEDDTSEDSGNEERVEVGGRERGGNRRKERKRNRKASYYHQQRQHYRWCSKCNVSPPKGSYHCRDCGVCILQYDHHCPWTSKCIGRNNQYLFYGWICSVFVAIMYMGFMVAIHASPSKDGWSMI